MDCNDFESLQGVRPIDEIGQFQDWRRIVECDGDKYVLESSEKSGILTRRSRKLHPSEYDGWKTVEI